MTTRTQNVSLLSPTTSWCHALLLLTCNASESRVKAIELYAARDLQRALSVYNLALKHDPASSSVWVRSSRSCGLAGADGGQVNRGDCYRELQEIGLALQV